MHYFILPDKDATIYTDEPTQNTGLDEILSLEKVIDDYAGTIDNSRILIKFDLSTISAFMAANVSGIYKAYLNLYTTSAENLPLSYDIYVYPVSQSWEMGKGKRYDNPITEIGASWRYRDGYVEWVSGSGASGSGANFYTSSYATQSYANEYSDIRVDVTSIFNQWISGTITNDGFILKRSETDESSSADLGVCHFYGHETHTIYQPKLELVWNDATYVTGSLSALSIDNIVMYMKSLNGTYRTNTKNRFRLVARERYPTKTFSTTSSYAAVKYMPTSSYYSVYDYDTNECIVPFGEYSRLSCDGSGNYFDLYFNGYEPDRFYKFIFKTKDSTGIETVVDSNFIFKVVR